MVRPPPSNHGSIACHPLSLRRKQLLVFSLATRLTLTTGFRGANEKGIQGIQENHPTTNSHNSGSESAISNDEKEQFITDNPNEGGVGEEPFPLEPSSQSSTMEYYIKQAEEVARSWKEEPLTKEEIAAGISYAVDPSDWVSRGCVELRGDVFFVV